MFNIKFYSFSKKDNSTLRPVGGDTFECILNDSSSILNPVIKVNIGIENAPSYNYAYIEIFKRYYYISNWSYDLGFWIASMKSDVLASYKEVIGSNNLYVLRASNDSDGNIKDNMYPCKANMSIKQEEFPNIWETDINSGYYVVGIINSEVGGVGATTYYTLNWVQMKTLNSFLMGSTDWLGIDATAMVEGIQKILFNPYQYLVSCMWFPFVIETGDYSIIKYGWWETSSSGALTSNFIYSNNFDIDIPKHDQIATRGEYLQSEPYSQYYLCFYPFGIVKLDSSDLYNSDYISLRVTVDLITGVGRLVVAVGSNVIHSVMSQVGIPIQLSQITTDYIGMAQSIIGGASRIGTGYATMGVTGGIVSGISAIGNIAESIAPKVSSSGSGGGFSSLFQSFTNNTIGFYGVFFPVLDEDNEHRGRPLCQKRLISSLGGYILVSDGDIAISGTVEENTQIKGYLENGFYYE